MKSGGIKKLVRSIVVMAMGIFLLLIGVLISLQPPVWGYLLNKVHDQVSARFGDYFHISNLRPGDGLGEFLVDFILFEKLNGGQTVVQAENIRGRISPFSLFSSLHLIDKLEIGTLRVWVDLQKESTSKVSLSINTADVLAQIQKYSRFTFTRQIEVHEVEFLMTRDGQKWAEIKNAQLVVVQNPQAYRLDFEANTATIKPIAGIDFGNFDMSFSLVYQKEKIFKKSLIALRHFTIKGQGFDVALDGEIPLTQVGKSSLSNRLSVRLDFDFGLLSEAQIPEISIGGMASFQGDIRTFADLNEWKFSGDFNADRIEFHGFSLEYFGGKIDATPKLLQIENGEALIKGSKIGFRLQSPLDKKLSYSAEVHTRDLSLYYLLYDLGIQNAWVDLNIDADIKGYGAFFPKFSFGGTAKGKVSNLLVLDGPADGYRPAETFLRIAHDVSVEMGLYVDTEAFRFIKGRIKDKFSEGEVDCALYFEANRGMELTTRFQEFDFRSIEEEIASIRFEGKGSAVATIKGLYEDLVINSPVKFSRFSLAGVELGKLNGDVSFLRSHLIFENVEMNLAKSFVKGRVELDFQDEAMLQLDLGFQDSYIEDFLSTLGHSPFGARLNPRILSLWQGLFEGNLHLRGKMRNFIEDAAGGIKLELFPNGRFLEQLTGRGLVDISLSRSALQINKMKLELLAGLVEVSGEIHLASQDLALELSANGLKLARLHFEDAALDLIEGKVDVEYQIEGSLKQPKGFGTIRANNIAVRDVFLRDLELVSSFSPDFFLISGRLFSGAGQGKFRVEISESAPFKLELLLNEGRHDYFFEHFAFDEVPFVWAGGHVRVSGNLAGDGNQFQGDLALTPLFLRIGDVQWRNKDPISATFTNEKIDIDAFTMTGKGDTRLSLRGRVSERQMDLNIEGEASLSESLGLFPGVEDARGRLNCIVHVLGPLSDPQFDGEIMINNGEFLFDPIGLKLSNLQSRIFLEGRQIHIESIDARAKEGDFHIAGTVFHRNLQIIDTNLEMRFNDLEIYFAELEASLKMDANLMMIGERPQFKIKGNIKIEEALMTKNWSGAPTSSFSRDSLISGLGFPVSFDVKVKADENIVIDNSIFQAELKGDLHIVGSLEHLGVGGTLTLLSGEAYFKNNTFRLLEGQINFDNPDEIEPILNISAETEIQEYQVQVVIEGPADSPSVRLSSQPSLPEIDILSLVAFGFTRQDKIQFGEFAQTTGFDVVGQYIGLESQINALVPDFIRRAKIVRVQQLRFSSMYSSARERSSLPAVTLGVDLLGGMKLRLQTALAPNQSGDIEKRAQLEYKLSRKWRLQFEWYSQRDGNFSDIGADIWHRIEF